MYSKTTRMLLVISTVFLVLTTPIALSKVRYFVGNFLGDTVDHASASHTAFDSKNGSALNPLMSEVKYTAIDELIERFSCYLYYLNFSINFLLYTFNGPKFKRALIDIFKRRQSPRFI